MAKKVPQAHGGVLNIREKGDPASPDVGRPRRTLRVVLDELDAKGFKRVSKEDVLDAYERVVNLSEDDLKRAVGDSKNPMIVRIVGRELLKGKSFDVLERMLDRAQGRAQQSVDHTTGGHPFSINTVNYGNHDPSSIPAKAIPDTNPSGDG